MKNRCFKLLREVSPAYGILPKSYHLPHLSLNDTIPYASGGFADIWKGQLDRRQVCIKAFRTQAAGNLEGTKRVRVMVLQKIGVNAALITIRCSIARSLSGNTSFTRTPCPSPGYQKPCFRSASLTLGCQTETSSITLERTRGSIDYSWLATSLDLRIQTA